MKVLFLEIDTDQAWGVASLGPAFIAAYIRERGHEASFLRVPLDMSEEEVIAFIRDDAPDMLGFSLTTRQWQRARSYVRAIRAEIDVPVIAGGLHPTFSAAEVLANPGFDYVCIGEGEEPMAELLAVIQREGRDFKTPIENIWTKRAPSPGTRKPIEPIDSIPFLSRDFLDEHYGCIHMTTQRGCPFACTYCAARMYDEMYEGIAQYGRRRTHENVLLEIDSIHKGSEVNYIVFLDDTFTIHHHWVREFCKLYSQYFGMPFSLNARVETVDAPLLELLADAGCKHITYGVESGSPRVRKDILRRSASNERFIDVFRWTREAGIMATANYILGFPGETRADMDMTLELHEHLMPDDFAYFVFYPYPGTQLFKECRDKGYLPENYLDLEANHRQTILRLPDLSDGDIEEYFQKWTDARGRGYERQHGGQMSAGAKLDTREFFRRLAATG